MSMELLGGLWLLVFAVYSLHYFFLLAGDATSGAFSAPYTRSRMVQRAGFVFLVMSTAALVVATTTLASAVWSGVAAGIVKDPTVGSLWPSPAGAMANAGSCGNTIVGGAFSGTLGMLAVAHTVGVFLLLVLFFPTCCPRCAGVRIGTTDPITTRVPLFLAPAGLVWPPCGSLSAVFAFSV